MTIHFNLESGVPLYEQIYEYIKQEIQVQNISCKEKLPSTRRLATYLGISRSTVELAYEQLLSEGYIESVPYKGYYVAQMEGLYRFVPSEAPVRAKEPEKKKEYRYDFNPSGVDLKSFPYAIWRKLSKEILSDDRIELFRQGDPQGEYGLRKAIAAYLHQARGVNCTPEQVIVGAGSDYMLFLLSSILGNPRKIAFESPTYRQAYRLFQRLGYDVSTVSMDQSGMRTDKLRQSGAELAYVMPSHQYPLGIVMPVKRRMQLLAWAAEKDGTYLIEDDYDSEFRYKGKPIPALQGFDSHEKVIYLGTFSKSIAPAIRMSYMVLPQPLLEVYQTDCRFISSTVSKVDQMIVQRFIEEGYYERHLNKMRALYKGRHDTLLSELKPLLSRCTISGEHAGVHLLFTFPEGITEESLIRKAEEQSIKVYGLSQYAAEEEKPLCATILLGFANINETKIKEAAEILNRIWK